jgi:hypothetical protein
VDLEARGWTHGVSLAAQSLDLSHGHPSRLEDGSIAGRQVIALCRVSYKFQGVIGRRIHTFGISECKDLAEGPSELLQAGEWRNIQAVSIGMILANVEFFEHFRFFSASFLAGVNDVEGNSIYATQSWQLQLPVDLAVYFNTTALSCISLGPYYWFIIHFRDTAKGPKWVKSY